MQVNGGPRRPRRAHGRAAAGQAGLINGFRAKIDVEKLTCIIKEGTPPVNPLSASCFNNFDNQPNRPPILVAVNIPRIKDGKMELAVLLGRLGAVAVCWSVALRFPYTVSSADLETLDPCGPLLDTAAVFELGVGLSNNWLEQCGFGPVARQALETAVLQQQPLDLQVVLWPLVPMPSVTNSWTVSFGVHFAKQQSPVQSLEVRNVTLPYLCEFAHLLDTILTLLHAQALHFKGSQDDRLPEQLKLNPGATPGKKVLRRAWEIVEVVGSSPGEWAVFGDKRAAQAYGSTTGDAKMAAATFQVPETAEVSSPANKQAHKAPILVLSNNKQVSFSAAAPNPGPASAALDSLLPAVLPRGLTLDPRLGKAFGDFLGAYIKQHSKSREVVNRHPGSNSGATHLDEALIAQQQAAAPGISRHARSMNTGDYDRLDSSPPLPAAAAPPAGFQAPGSSARKRKQPELCQDFSWGHEADLPSVQDTPDGSHTRRSSSASCMSKCAGHSGLQQPRPVQDTHGSSDDDSDLLQLLADAADGVGSP